MIFPFRDFSSSSPLDILFPFGVRFLSPPTPFPPSKRLFEDDSLYTVSRALEISTINAPRWILPDEDATDWEFRFHDAVSFNLARGQFMFSNFGVVRYFN